VKYHDEAPWDVHHEAQRDPKNRRTAADQLQASEHDAFAAHLYQSRREYRLACDHSGKSGKQIERCLISTFKVAESIGFKGDFRQWEELLRIGD
jgi:hypothetical protein